MSWKRHLGLIAAATFVSLYTVVSLTVPRSFALTVFGDLTALALILVGMTVMAMNAASARGQTRTFWLLMTSGFTLWASNQCFWCYYEILLRRPLPDPCVADIILFIHIVPMMAAVALRPHRTQAGEQLYFSTLNFLTLLAWWIFLYTFIIFPDEYVALNRELYSRNYDLLYSIEILVLVTTLGVSAISAQGEWKKIYSHLFAAAALYFPGSWGINLAIERGQYYTGSLYDLPFMLSLVWFVWAVLLARRLKPQPDPATKQKSRWLAMAPRMAMFAILSLPLLGLWTLLFDLSPARLRHFRLLVMLTAMLVLGAFLFLKLFLLDRRIVLLLDQTNRGFDNLQRLQTQLVQREKLASLGQLVAGAAHEINNPLAAILGYSELLVANQSLDGEQLSMARKIGQHARRTRDLVSDLLSFAQQTPGEKSSIDVGSLLQRALQTELFQAENIRIELKIEPSLPRLWGNSNQLFQACVQVIENAVDALQGTAGGLLTISARHEGKEVVLEFSDTGPGMREPQRVFDPFYTTKPVGKGTGLGLSATYGVVQHHHGQITCHNKREGGAVFTIRLPIAATAKAAAR